MQDLIDIAEDGNQVNQAFRFKRGAITVASSTSASTASEKEDDKKCKQQNKKHQ